MAELFIPFVTQGLDLIFSFFLFHFLIGICLSRIDWKSCKKVSKPKFSSLFSIKKLKITLGCVYSFTSYVVSFEIFYNNELRKVVRNWNCGITRKIFKRWVVHKDYIDRCCSFFSHFDTKSNLWSEIIIAELL